MSIQEHLNKIRNAVYGHEVRESIAKGIETAYDDASEKDNANMEVKIARGTHPNLRSRLEEVDNKQQQTTAQLQQTEYAFNAKLHQTEHEFNAQLEDIANKGTTVEVVKATTKAEIDRQIADGTLVNLTIEDNSIGGDKIKERSISLSHMQGFTESSSVNCFNKNDTLPYLYNSDGSINYNPPATVASTNFIKVKSGDVIRRTGKLTGGVNYLYSSKNFLMQVSSEGLSEIIVPDNSSIAYVVLSFFVSTKENLMITVNNPLPLEYSPYEESLYTSPQELIINDVNITNTKAYKFTEKIEDIGVEDVIQNVFDKSKAVLGAYNNSGVWVDYTVAHTSDFIAVKPNETFTKNQANGEEIALFNKDKVRITMMLTKLSETFTIPDDANIAYMRVKVMTGGSNPISLDDFMVVRGSVLPDSYVSYTPYTGDQKKLLRNLNLVKENVTKEFLEEVKDNLGLMDEAKDDGIIYTNNKLHTLRLTGDMSGMSADVRKTLDFKLYDNQNFEVLSGKTSIKWQGSSSLTYPKKNFSAKMYDDSGVKMPSKFNNWYPTNEFHFKANYADKSMVRNIVASTLCRNTWDGVYPNDAKGTVEGFPFIMYINGTFQGCYTWNLKQDNLLFGMDENNPKHLAFRGEALGTWDRSNIEIRSDIKDEVEAERIINDFLTWTENCTDADFKANINSRMDLQNLIDYWLFVDFSGNADGVLNNVTFGTWDGEKVYIMPYDWDNCFGGSEHPYYHATADLRTNPKTTPNPIWGKLFHNFDAELKSRYAELRGYYFKEDMYDYFVDFQDVFGYQNINREYNKWSARPSDNHIGKIETYIKERIAYLDGIYDYVEV